MRFSDLHLPRASEQAVEQRIARICWSLVAVGVLIPAITFVTELILSTPDLNDSAFHQGVAHNLIAALGEGVNPLDFWVPTWVTGFALFRYYNPLPYFVLAVMHAVLGHAVSLAGLYRLLLIAVLTAFPLANHRALRWLGLPRETAAWGAFLGFWIAANAAFGIELESFTWAGPSYCGDSGAPLSDGIVFRHGIGTHAASRLSYDINRNFRRFETGFAADDEANRGQKMQFRILGDDEMLFDSGIISGVGFPRFISVDVTDVEILTLEVSEGGDTNNSDHADWVEPILRR